MNKKFSTLMAGLMLASAFSVNAAEYKDGKFYLLQTGSGAISVVSEPGANYGQLYLDSNVSGLTDTRNSLWKVSVTKEDLGDAPKYSFVNVATGQILSVATPTEKTGSTYDALEDQFVAGKFQEWYNGLSSTAVNNNGELFMSYVGTNDVVYLEASSTSEIKVNGEDVKTIDVKRGDVNAASAGLKVHPEKAAIVSLGADELNRELIMNNKAATFSLSFDRDVTEGAENLFTGVEFKAVNGVDETSTGGKDYTGYVKLNVKDTENYLVVDTNLHTGSEALKQLPKFAYDNPSKDQEGNAVLRYEDSYYFKFAYDPTSNRILIKSKGYVKKISATKPTSTTQTADGNSAFTYWPTDASKRQLVENAYIRLVELSDVRELTVASGVSGDENTTTPWVVGDNKGADNLEFGMLTTVTIGEGLMAYVPTTIPTGLYTIQYKGSNKDTKATDNYYIANLKGTFGYAEQAKNQLYDHIPAAQWYVQQNGDIPTAPVTISNREFDDQSDNSNFENLQAFQGPDGTYFFLGGAFKNDTLKFIEVSAASKADSLLGYKHVDEEQASVEIYNFNYLHGLSLDNGLNTPTTDSLVRVDETGEKAAFRLIPVVEHDSYGKQFAKKDGVANLVRNAYYVKTYDNSKFNGERYLNYDKASKKYVMSTTAQPFFLKENNCIDGTHYYALVEANFYELTANKITATELASVVFYPKEMAGMNVENDKVAKDYKADYTANKDKFKEKAIVKFYDKNGQPIVTDASEDVALYAYQENADNTIELIRVKKDKDGSTAAIYFYMNPTTGHKGVGATTDNTFDSKNYADERVSVDDNTLDLTQAVLSDKFTESEIRVSAFEVKVIDSPLYRRFNGAAPETYGDAANSPLNLKFFRYNNPAEYLFENYSSENKYRDGINDKSISFLGVNNAYQFEETATRSYTMYVDTAYVRNNTRMPQYLIGVRPEVVEGDTILCDASTHQHKTPEEALACEHTQIKVGFTRAMYLFNAQDSVDVKNYDYQGKAAYGADKYTRLAFKDAVHAQDTLYILNPGVTTEQLVAGNFKNEDLFADKIALDNNKHKNVVFQFRLIDDENNRFLIESESDPEMIAPEKGGWIKIQNGVPVIARFDTFKEAIAQAEIFDVNDEIKYDATANDEIAVEGVSVVAGNGQVTIMGAAGKNVTITNILGKVIASQVIASDNATIAVPAGIVAVAVEGEAAVKAIVK